MQTVTPAQIDGQLAALATALVDLDAEAERLSLGAVSGDKKAIEALATVHAKIAQASTDRTVLSQARAAAAKLENAATDAAGEAERATAMKQAQAHAGKIVSKAGRADALVDEFRKLLAALGEDERSIWAALRKAGEAPVDGRVGQKGIDVFALDAMSKAHKGQALRPRTVSEIAAVAWGYLREGETK